MSKNTSKRILGIVLVIAILIATAGCSGIDFKSGNAEKSSQSNSELYVQVTAGQADIFLFSDGGQIIEYKENVSTAHFTELINDSYQVAVGKEGYSLFKETVTVNETNELEVDLEKLDSPPVTINVTATDATDEISTKLSGFTAGIYKNGEEINSTTTSSEVAALGVWRGVVYDYKVEKSDYINYEKRNTVYLESSGTDKVQASLLPGRKQTFSASDLKTLDLGTLATGETAIVGISPLNFDPTDNTATYGSLDVNYSEAASGNSNLVKLSSKQTKTNLSANMQSHVSQSVNKTSQAQQLLDKKMRKLSQELKLDAQVASKTRVNTLQADTTAADLSLGKEKSFYVMDSLTSSSYSQITATLKRKDSNVYLFVEQGVYISASKLDEIANKFNNQIYSSDLNNFAAHDYNQNNLYDIDGNGRPIILITDLEDLSQDAEGTIAGAFDPWHYYNKSTSNQADMMYINSNLVKNYSVNQTLSTLAHEFQHLIYFVEKNLAWNEAGQPDKSFSDHWLNEGFAGLAEYLNGYYTYTEGVKVFDAEGSRGYFNTPADESLLYWNQELSDYGASNLFALYLYDQYGQEIIKKINDTYQAPRQVIANYTDRDFADLFLDWILTNQITNQGISAKYSYQQSGITLDSRPKYKTITTDNINNFDIRPNGVQYYEIEGDGRQVELEIKNFNQPTGVVVYRK